MGKKPEENCILSIIIFHRLISRSFRQSLAAFKPKTAANFSNKMAGIQELPKPIKSSQDVKDYKLIQLPNGLKALLVSDTSYDLEKLDKEEAELAKTVPVEKEGDKEGDKDDSKDDHDNSGLLISNIAK